MEKISNRKKQIFLLSLSGIFIGVLNGLFGGGGGMICVPLFKKIMKADDKTSHATTVFIMALMSIPSMIIYITNFGTDVLQAVLVSVGVLLGGLLGAKLLNKLNNNVINIIFIILMFGVGIKMLF